jgi:type I restriction enzyme, S subunit
MKTIQLCKVASVFNGKTPSKAEQRPKGLPVLKIKDIYENGNFKGVFNSFVDNDFFEKFKSKSIQNGDTLILNAAHNSEYVGSKQYFVEDGVIGAIATGEWLIIRPNKKEILPKYVSYWLSSKVVHHQIKKLVRGIHLYPKDVDVLEIPLPPLTEQKRIATILDKADAIRRKRQQVMKLANEFLRATFLDMFGDPVLNPKNWEEKLLGEIADIASGVTKGRKFNGKKTISVCYMRVANVQDGYIDLNDIKEIEALETDIDKYSLQSGDILLTEGGDPDKLGRGAVWKGEIDPCIHQNHVFRVRVEKSIAYPEYLNALIGSSRGKRYFLKAAKQTTGIASINMTQLKGFPVLLPPKNLQKQYGDLVKKYQNLLGSLDSMTQHDNYLFNSLTQRAFRGEL